MSIWKELEKFTPGQSLSLAEALPQLPWNELGLLPAIAQQHDSKEVLMMAWMNRASLEETIKTGRVCYFSRSRQQLWRKGEISGQTQALKEMRFDCDGDTILLMVDQLGSACHTGRRQCFYNLVKDDQLVVDSEPLIDPSVLYGK